MSASNVGRAVRAVLLGALCATATPAWGHPFENAPEDSGLPWETPFPYQRNVFWDFDAVSPVGGPTSQGTPGAIYEGLDDATLRVSDFVEFTGATQWYRTAPGVPAGAPDYTGVIGIDNRQGTADLTGTAIFHLDNFDRLFETKHIWLEYTGVRSDPTAQVGIDLVAPPGYATTTVGPINTVQLPGEPVLFLQNFWFEVRPNPPWEELHLTFTVAAGGYAFFDTFHVATECVPEPSSIVALGTGLVGLAGYGWRRRTRTARA